MPGSPGPQGQQGEPVGIVGSDASQQEGFAVLLQETSVENESTL